MDQAIRNKLRNVVTQCRKLLEESVAQQLQGKYDIFVTGKKDEVRAEKDLQLKHLSDEDRQARQDILAHFDHIKALGYKPKEALEQLIREIAFTHLNRFCAYKMMEVRDVYVGGQKFREAVSKGLKSQGFLFYLAEHPEDERRYNAGHQDEAYCHFLNWLGGTLSQEIGVLFSPSDPANRVYPPQRVLDHVLELINSEQLKGIWSEDETIGWVYQYFTPKELRDQARKESQAPRNSYELAFRNQFFTPRYVVEFLTDNTLGRIWYEMRKGNTRLKDECRFMVRRPDEVFLADLTNNTEEEGTVTPDLAFLIGRSADLPPFELPQAIVRPAVEEKPGCFRMGWFEYDDAEKRLSQFAHAVRFFDWSGDPRMPELRQKLAEWNTGQPEEPVDGRTQDLWDLLLAVHRAERFCDGAIYSALTALTRIANEIRRRLLVARKEGATQEELLRAPALIPDRPKKDPREIKILDPACGSGHFLLYCFALLLVIYDEAYDDPDLGPALQADFPTKDDMRRAVPGLILQHNLHGIDIDRRCTQIAALALWLRCQRAYQETGLKKDRPRITRSNIVCAEPMPGEGHMLKEFVSQLEPKLLGQLVEVVFDKMKLAGEAGALLKIEEKISDAVAEARRQWRAGPVARQLRLFGEPQPVERAERFDLSGITDAQFFEQAEAQVVDALRIYAEQAQGSQRLQRRLFADDAVRGFAFVDICHKTFDVVLMNPPFGLPPDRVFSLLKSSVPQAYTNIYAAFLMRSSDLCKNGLVGAITSRSFLMTPRLTSYRQDYLLEKLKIILDLGLRVMDEAEVESCAYILAMPRSHHDHLLASDMRREDDKEQYIKQLGKDLSGLFMDANVGVVKQLPGSRVFYSLPTNIIDLFSSGTTFSPSVGTARCGGRTFDNFRFLRLRWEVAPHSIGAGAIWAPFCKGGDFSTYYGQIPLLIKWENDGAEISQKNIEVNGQTAQARQASSYYFRKGATYSRKSKGFGVRVMPQGCIFGEKGPAIFSESNMPVEYVVGWLNTRFIRRLVELQANKSQYDTGSICRLPWRLTVQLVCRRSVQRRHHQSCRPYEVTLRLDRNRSVFCLLRHWR